MEKYRSKITCKLLALMLAVAVGVTFAPVYGGAAYAADEDQASGEITEVTGQGDEIAEGEEITEGEDIEVSLEDPADDAIDITDGDAVQDDEDVIVEEEPAAQTESADEAVAPDAVQGAEADAVQDAVPEDIAEDIAELSVKSGAKGKEISDAKDMYTMDVTRSGATVKVKAAFKGEAAQYFKFTALCVDGSIVKEFDSTSVSGSVNMNNFDIGMHEVYLVAMYLPTGDLAKSAVSKQKTNITAKPTYKGVFEVYWNNFTFAPYNMARANSKYNLYMEYSANGGKTWKKTGYMKCNDIELYISQKYKISGLKPNTKYRTRIFYGKTVDGKFYRGPVLNTATIKTGQKSKPAIKSVKAKAVKVKYHKVKHYGYYTGVYLYTEKFYTYKVKVTVKLKKKPGTTGIWINGKFIKGNKKKYTATFTPYPNYSSKKPKGRVKFTVKVRSYQNKGYYGFSPQYSKTKKLK